MQITVLMVITDFLEPFLSLSIKVFNSVKRREKQTSVHTEQIELKFLSEKKKVFLHSIRSSYKDLDYLLLASQIASQIRRALQP